MHTYSLFVSNIYISHVTPTSLCKKKPTMCHIGWIMFLVRFSTSFRSVYVVSDNDSLRRPVVVDVVTAWSFRIRTLDGHSDRTTLNGKTFIPIDDVGKWLEGLFCYFRRSDRFGSVSHNTHFCFLVGPASSGHWRRVCSAETQSKWPDNRYPVKKSWVRFYFITTLCVHIISTDHLLTSTAEWVSKAINVVL